MPNITDQELAELRRLKHVENTVLKNPTVKRKFFSLYKEADPQAIIPELEQAEAADAAVDAKLKSYKEELEDTRRRLLEREAEEANTRQRDRLTRPPFNLSSSEIDEVITYQAEAHKNGELISLENAARAWLQIHSVANGRQQPRLAFSTRGNRPKNDFRKALKDPKSELFKDPRGYVAAQAEEAREELREAFGESLV
jgi:hypothetical protein